MIIVKIACNNKNSSSSFDIIIFLFRRHRIQFFIAVSIRATVQ